MTELGKIQKIIIGAFIFVLLFFVFSLGVAFAQPFSNPGPLDPGCSPTDSSCYVSAETSETSDSGVGYEIPNFISGNFYDAVTPDSDPENSPSRYFELADINNDSKLDAVVADSDAGKVNVLTGNGDGTFNTMSQYVPTITNSRVSDVATADFNGDGQVDIAVSSGADSFDTSIFSGFSVMLNQGSASFNQTVTTYSTIHPSNSISVPWRIFADDIDDDGDSDILLLDAGWTGQYLWVYLNDGSGVFDSGASYPLNTWPYDLSVGNIDGDGNKDIVVAVNGHGFVSLVGNGDGTFQTPTAIYDGEARSDMSSLSLADMDRDGYDDIVSISAHVPTIIVFPNTQSAPYFTNTPDMYDGPGCGACFNVFSHTLKTPDLDHDGFPDVVIPLMTTDGGVDGFDTYINDQSGSINFYKQYATTGGDVFGLEMGDVNSDSKEDIVLLESTIGKIGTYLSTPSQLAMNLSQAGLSVDVTTGYVGIGTDTPTSKLHVVSDGVAPIATFTDDTHTATCDIDAAGLTCSSDERLKKNIHTFENSLEGLLSLTPVKYLWNTEDEETSKEKIGFKAQDIQRVFPELVKEASNGYLSVNYAGFSPLLTAAIQEMYQDFNDIQPLGKTSATKQITAFLSDAKDKVVNGFVFVEEMFANVFLAETAQIDDLQVVEEFCVGNICVEEEGFEELLKLNDIEYFEYDTDGVRVEFPDELEKEEATIDVDEDVEDENIEEGTEESVEVEDVNEEVNSDVVSNDSEFAKDYEENFDDELETNLDLDPETEPEESLEEIEEFAEEGIIEIVEEDGVKTANEEVEEDVKEGGVEIVEEDDIETGDAEDSL